MGMNDISLESVKKSIKKRPKDIHKGNCGRLLIFAGAGGMAGAAALAAGAAMRTGAGRIAVAITPEKKKEIIEKYSQYEGDTGSPEVQIALLSFY